MILIIVCESSNVLPRSLLKRFLMDGPGASDPRNCILMASIMLVVGGVIVKAKQERSCILELNMPVLGRGDAGGKEESWCTDLDPAIWLWRATTLYGAAVAEPCSFQLPQQR
jgi:hypothetical protein